MNRIIILPNGNRVDLANIRDYRLDGYTIVLTDPNGNNITYSDPNAIVANIEWVLAQVDYVNQNGSAAPYQITAGSFQIDSISPSVFDITTDTITLLGSGFNPSLLGIIYIEDWPGGGLDDNGYSMTPTFVSKTKLTAVFRSVGDSALGPGDLRIYHRDSNGVVSNLVSGTNLAGTVVSIP